MSGKYERCRWSSSDSLGDYYCVNDASEYCTECVNVDTDICDDCNHFFSCVNNENFKPIDKDTKELI